MTRFLKIIAILMLFISSLSFAGEGGDVQEKNINGEPPRVFYEALLSDLLAHPKRSIEEEARKYFTQDAVNIVDGVEVPLDQQIQHFAFIQKNAKIMTFDVKQCVFDGEWLAARHIGHTELNDGKAFDSEVAIFLHFAGGKIDQSYELTRPISGAATDKAIHTVR